jgi:regulator of ribonuclease activity A
MLFQTADLYDAHSDSVTVAEPGYIMIGLKPCFGGEIVTVKCHEDNSLVRETLGTDGSGKVLVVDGGGSLRCALVGDRLAQKAIDNGWEGIIVHGCIRDSMIIDKMETGIKCLSTNPTRSIKRGVGLLNETVTFSSATFRPGEYVYADRDGILVSPDKLI